ncbi:polysaccharide deacetylase family protein [Pararhodonellum marinum]|uniref:polysaccharide deacetylase family protein n=1 Tax=Pararhodonellum marinum TaxID=2755358 RepID=UPI00188FD527|nr:polysaccharide deacetylase family protein [Pararhodonellum marinum]
MALFSLGLDLTVFAQSATGLNERLGFNPTDKLLIIHADDIGLSHSENRATLKAMTEGLVNSTSIMMPCAWATEVGTYIQNHPNLDVGVHLTLTNEWFNYKWGPVASKSNVPGLVDEEGFMFADCASVARHATPEEVEAELRAQIDAAIKLGIKPTHLDSHMGCLFFGRPEYFMSYLKLGREYGIPSMVSPQILDVFKQLHPDYFNKLDLSKQLIIDQISIATPEEYDEKGMEGFYSELLENLNPGVTALLIHVAYDDPEMQAITVNHPHWHAAWRQADFDFFTSDKARKLILDNEIKLITWREIGSLLEQKSIPKK